MDEVQRIAVEKDRALTDALRHAAAVNEAGMSEADLLRYLALIGADNLPEPYQAPTPEQIQGTIDIWTKGRPWDRQVLDRIDDLAWRSERECASRSDDRTV